MLEKIKKPHCMRCGKHINLEEIEYCVDCARIPKSFKRGYPVFAYEGAIKTALYDFKYKNQREFATFFATCVSMYYKAEFARLSLDGIIPVPIHRRKRKSRGYNQAELLAIELGKQLKLPVFKDYLVRDIYTDPQKELNDQERMENLKNAFKMGANQLKLKKVLLVDDIYTSGATMEACTQVLRRFGVEEVYCTSVAIGKGY